MLAIDLPEDQVQAATLPPREPVRPGIVFRELTTGTCRSAPDAPPAAVSAQLTLQIPDLAAFLADPDHRARIAGRITLPTLTAPAGAPVEDDTLNLLARTGEGRRRTMAHTLPFTERGRPAAPWSWSVAS